MKCSKCFAASSIRLRLNWRAVNQFERTKLSEFPDISANFAVQLCAYALFNIRSSQELISLCVSGCCFSTAPILRRFVVRGFACALFECWPFARCKVWKNCWRELAKARLHLKALFLSSFAVVCKRRELRILAPKTMQINFKFDWWANQPKTKVRFLGARSRLGADSQARQKYRNKLANV